MRMIKVKKVFFQTQRTQSFSDLKVHGTCSENSREFIGIRIVWCDTGDSPRGQGGRRAPAAVGRAVESSQAEESPETAKTAPLPGTVPAVADTRGNEVGRSTAKRARYGPEVCPKVHGTCRENPREFIGIRIIWCATGDSPRGQGGSPETAAVGRTAESSQTEESPETATTAPLPGTVPAVADTPGE